MFGRSSLRLKLVLDKNRKSWQKHACQLLQVRIRVVSESKSPVRVARERDDKDPSSRKGEVLTPKAPKSPPKPRKGGPIDSHPTFTVDPKVGELLESRYLVQDTVSGRGVFSNVPTSMPRKATLRFVGILWPVLQVIQLISLAMLGSNMIQIL
eukprot:s526_g24.t1